MYQPPRPAIHVLAGRAPLSTHLLPCLHLLAQLKQLLEGKRGGRGVRWRCSTAKEGRQRGGEQRAFCAVRISFAMSSSLRPLASLREGMAIWGMERATQLERCVTADAGTRSPAVSCISVTKRNRARNIAISYLDSLDRRVNWATQHQRNTQHRTCILSRTCGRIAPFNRTHQRSCDNMCSSRSMQYS